MRTHQSALCRRGISVLANLLTMVATLFCWTSPASGAAADSSSAKPASANGLVPLMLELPPPAFIGTPVDLPSGPNIEPPQPREKVRPPMPVPPGLTNIARTAKLTCSDAKADAEELAKIINGNKDGTKDENVVLLHKGLQHVQMDLGGEFEIFAVVVWRGYEGWKAFRCMVVQAADDAGLKKNVHILFNNDMANTVGLGVGTDRQYFENHEGKLIDAKGVKARYLRFYSNGSTANGLNEYCEIEVYGRPPK